MGGVAAGVDAGGILLAEAMYGRRVPVGLDSCTIPVGTAFVVKMAAVVDNGNSDS